MKLQILKDNRNQVIAMIEKATDNDLKDMMIAVAEIAQMGCYFDMDDMDDIISDAIEQVDSVIIKEGTIASNWLAAKNRENAIKNMPSSMR